MSLHESNGPKQILRTFSLQENVHTVHRRPQKKCEYKLSDELQKIKDEYETLERRNQEELAIIQKQFGGPGPDCPDFQEFLGKKPGCSSRETIKNFQILINNEFTGSIETKRDLKREIEDTKFENQKLDLMLTSKIDEIAFMKEKFATFTETYKTEAEKLVEQERRTKQERDELRRKLDETHRKYEKQSNFIQELDQNNHELKLKLDETNKDIDRQIRGLMFEAETEKKRYLANLKKLIELFQIEKQRIEETLNNLNTDINIEKNQHFQDVEQLKQLIDQLNEEIEKSQQEKALLYEENQKLSLVQKFDPEVESHFQVLQEVEEHRKYSHELEMIIKNLGIDNQNLEVENSELKKRYEDKLDQIKRDAEDNRQKLHEELEMFKHKFTNLQEIKAENEYILAENETLKTNADNIEQKYVRRIRVINVEFGEKQHAMSLQIEKQNKTIEELNNAQSKLKDIITNIEIELKNKSNECKDIEFARQNLESLRIELQNNLDKSRQVFDQTVREYDDRIQQLRTFQETEVKKLKTEINRLQKESKDFQTGMIEQETQYKILKVDFDECLLDRDEYQVKRAKERDLLNQDFQKKIDELNSQIAELQTINLNYEEIEQDLHKQIQGLVHNINELNFENQREVEGLREEIRKQIGHELEELQCFKNELEEQIKLNEKENARLKTELQFKTQRCVSLEDELKGLKVSHKDLSLILEDSKERYEDEIEQLKLSNERIMKRNKDEITKLLKEFEQQSQFCDHLDKRKKELERLNKNLSDNLEHVTKVYERDLKDLKLDLQNTKTFYENKISHAKTEAIFETKKYENRINELEQELKMVKYEVEWLKEAQKE